ncbi:MAG: SOS response-associated peptidase [Pirellulales bacterium]|nr:SOS response-associated peptidase [Pirellulales bacterium]
MCGRFTLRTPLHQLGDEFLFHPSEDLSLPPRFNIAPSQLIAGLKWDSGRKFSQFQWGLIPSWAKEPSVGYKMINCRSETIREKPSFRDAYKKRRCALFSDGYYEWQKVDGVKQPIFFHREDNKPFAFAGLWERWQQDPEQPAIESTTIITTASNHITETIHHRMPVILSSDDLDDWLDPGYPDLDHLHSLLTHPIDDNQMTTFNSTAVSTYVNNVRNTGSECIEPVARQQDLF